MTSPLTRYFATTKKTNRSSILRLFDPICESEHEASPSFSPDFKVSAHESGFIRQFGRRPSLSSDGDAADTAAPSITEANNLRYNLRAGVKRSLKARSRRKMAASTPLRPQVTRTSEDFDESSIRSSSQATARLTSPQDAPAGGNAIKVLENVTIVKKRTARSTSTKRVSSREDANLTHSNIREIKELHGKFEHVVASMMSGSKPIQRRRTLRLKNPTNKKFTRVRNTDLAQLEGIVQELQMRLEQQESWMHMTSKRSMTASRRSSGLRSRRKKWKQLVTSVLEKSPSTSKEPVISQQELDAQNSPQSAAPSSLLNGIYVLSPPSAFANPDPLPTPGIQLQEPEKKTSKVNMNAEVFIDQPQLAIAEEEAAEPLIQEAPLPVIQATCEDSEGEESRPIIRSRGRLSSKGKLGKKRKAGPKVDAVEAGNVFKSPLPVMAEEEAAEPLMEATPLLEILAICEDPKAEESRSINTTSSRLRVKGKFAKKMKAGTKVDAVDTGNVFKSPLLPMAEEEAAELLIEAAPLSAIQTTSEDPEREESRLTIRSRERLSLKGKWGKKMKAGPKVDAVDAGNVFKSPLLPMAEEEAAELLIEAAPLSAIQATSEDPEREESRLTIISRGRLSLKGKLGKKMKAGPKVDAVDAGNVFKSPLPPRGTRNCKKPKLSHRGKCEQEHANVAETLRRSRRERAVVDYAEFPVSLSRHRRKASRDTVARAAASTCSSQATAESASLASRQSSVVAANGRRKRKCDLFSKPMKQPQAKASNAKHQSKVSSELAAAAISMQMHEVASCSPPPPLRLDVEATASLPERQKQPPGDEDEDDPQTYHMHGLINPAYVTNVKNYEEDEYLLILQDYYKLGGIESKHVILKKDQVLRNNHKRKTLVALITNGKGYWVCASQKRILSKGSVGFLAPGKEARRPF